MENSCKRAPAARLALFRAFAVAKCDGDTPRHKKYASYAKEKKCCASVRARVSVYAVHVPVCVCVLV